jgi:hypothetical protein
MGNKFKITDKTTFDDAKAFIDELKSLNVVEISLNDLNKLFEFLGVVEIQSKGGSAIKFQHPLLKKNPIYQNGVFTVHVVHKGGDKRFIKRIDFKTFLYHPLIAIINQLKQIK